MFHVAAYDKKTDKYLGVIRPVVLRFNTKDEAETVAKRYRDTFPNEDFRPLEVHGTFNLDFS
jgi:hypothetical protein